MDIEWGCCTTGMEVCLMFVGMWGLRNVCLPGQMVNRSVACDLPGGQTMAKRRRRCGGLFVLQETRNRDPLVSQIRSVQEVGNDRLVVGVGHDSDNILK